MFAYVVVTYDVRMENEGVTPDPVIFASQYIPNMNAEVMFRKRRV